MISDLPQKLSVHRSELENSTGQGLALHERRWIRQLVPLEIPAGHPHGHGRLPGRHYDSHAAMTAAAHCPAPRIHEKRYQEAVADRRANKDRVSWTV
jgi:hypothetical protein